MILLYSISKFHIVSVSVCPQMSSTAEDLDSRHLTELVRQVQTSTKEYSFQYETLKDELEKREKRLLQIEKEQDDKSRAAKQRE